MPELGKAGPGELQQHWWAPPAGAPATFILEGAAGARPKLAPRHRLRERWSHWRVHSAWGSRSCRLSPAWCREGRGERVGGGWDPRAPHRTCRPHVHTVPQISPPAAAHHRRVPRACQGGAAAPTLAALAQPSPVSLQQHVHGHVIRPSPFCNGLAPPLTCRSPVRDCVHECCPVHLGRACTGGRTVRLLHTTTTSTCLLAALCVEGGRSHTSSRGPPECHMYMYVKSTSRCMPPLHAAVRGHPRPSTTWAAWARRQGQGAVPGCTQTHTRIIATDDGRGKTASRIPCNHDCWHRRGLCRNWKEHASLANASLAPALATHNVALHPGCNGQ